MEAATFEVIEVETVEITVVLRLLELLLLSLEGAAEVVVVVVEAVEAVLSFWLLVVGVARRGFKRLPPPTKLCSGNCIGDLLANGPIRGCFVEAEVVEVVEDFDAGLTSISKGSILSKFFLFMFSITSFMLMVPLCPEGGSNTGMMDNEGLSDCNVLVGEAVVGVVEVEAVEAFSPTNTTGLEVSLVLEAADAEAVAAELTSVMGGLELSDVVDAAEDVDLMITVLVVVEAEAATLTEAAASGFSGKLGVMTVTALEAEVDFTGETRTRRTLPSAETLTSLTGTILAPGGTICAGRTVTELPAPLPVVTVVVVPL